MRCTRVEKFLPLYVAGDLAGRRAERHVARHLATCESCRGLAEEYDASRDLVRDAATLPPDFDGAFYAEIRRSVLAEITRERTRLAPPPASNVFASLFNARFAYAASLILLFATVAALSLYSYIGRKSEIATANRERIGTPEATPVPTRTTASNDGRSVAPVEATVAEAKNGGSRQTAKPLSLKRRANSGNAQNETQRSLNPVNNAPVHAKRNPRAPVVAAPDEHTAEIAISNSGSATTAAPEVSRIEIQTSDPNIRIIWLSPRPDAVTEPLK
jgi:hypothetical protein